MTISVASNVTKFLELKTRDIVVPIVETDEVLNRSFVVSESARFFFLCFGPGLIGHKRRVRKS